MISRRKKREHLNPEQQIAEIHDDLDDGDKKFSAIMRENRAFFIAILLAVITVGLAGCNEGLVSANEAAREAAEHVEATPLIITDHPTPIPPVPTATRVPDPTPQPTATPHTHDELTLEELKEFCRPITIYFTEGCFLVFPD